jgi:hypothetical protein
MSIHDHFPDTEAARRGSTVQWSTSKTTIDTHSENVTGAYEKPLCFHVELPEQASSMTGLHQ